MRTLALNQNEPRSTKVQMSEAFITSVFLALSGGFQDAYTYFTRDGVFSNAQTGNVVLMSQHFMMGEWSEGLRYLFPLLAFAVGVFVAERIQGSFKYARKLHWRQSVLLCEMAILVFVGFLPENLNMAATVLVSFSCAMQVQTFRKVGGYSYASTMCIGNLRSGTQRFHCISGKKDRNRSDRHFTILESFYSLRLVRESEESVCEVRVSCDLDIRWTSVDQFSADVLRKD